MTKEKMKGISKTLSYILRHHPESYGLVLDEQGWVQITLLLEALRKKGQEISLETLKQVVAENDKQRFALDEEGMRIRANQGHSISVNLGIQPQMPPYVLFHGTAAKNLDTIRKEGIKKQKRQYVHLSDLYETAVQVGARHGSPLVLRINAMKMYEEGKEFFLSENKVWLTEEVKPEYIFFPGDRKNNQSDTAFEG